MKISTKGRYALRLMLDLAYNHTGNYIPIKSISKRQDLSEKYLEQIINQLVKAGLVLSARGAQGGYMLARESNTYTVGEILRLAEGSLAPTVCVEDTEKTCCPRIDDCVTFEVWTQIADAINNVVDHITLADLVARQQEKSQCCS